MAVCQCEVRSEPGCLRQFVALNIRNLSSSRYFDFGAKEADALREQRVGSGLGFDIVQSEVVTGDLGVQPSEARIKDQRVTQESAQLELGTHDFRFRDIAHAALKDLGVGRLVLQVVVSVEKGRAVEADPSVGKVSLDANLIGIDGFFFEDGQHHDGGDDILATKGEIRAAWLEATGIDA